MKRMACLFLNRNYQALIAITLLIIVRAIQSFAIKSGILIVGDSFEEAYEFCNASNIASFVLVPLVAVALIRPAGIMATEHFAVWSQSRQIAAFRCFFFVIVFGFCASIAINASALAAIEIGSAIRVNCAGVVLSTLMQGMVCAIASMFYMAFLLISGREAIAFMACVLYGLWDFMAQNVVGGGVPSIGWGLSIVLDTTPVSDAIFRFAIFGMILVALFLTIFICFLQKDYIPVQDSR